MIVRETLSIPRVAWNLRTQLGLTLVSSLVVTALHGAGFASVAIPVTPLTIVGAAISIFLAFRNSAAYDRYWEGRKLWGALVNWSRSFAREALALVGAAAGAGREPPELLEWRRAMVLRIVAFANALRCHLRGQPPLPELKPFLSETELATLAGARNVPSALVHGMGEALQEALARGWIGEVLAAQLDSALCELSNIQGGCERIRNTPLPRAYTFFTRRIVQAYCVLLPFALVGQLWPATALVVLPVAFTFLVLERVGQLLENPFGLMHNDLPLSA
ncbi:MAG: bestrophin family protein, partial [Myxococcales bacterium]